MDMMDHTDEYRDWELYPGSNPYNKMRRTTVIISKYIKTMLAIV